MRMFRLLLSVVAATVVAAVPASSAVALDFGVETFDGGLVDRDGATVKAATRAATHPDEGTIDFDLLTELRPLSPLTPVPSPFPAALMREVRISLPPGLVGDTTAIDTCTDVELITVSDGTSACPVGSQVGVVEIRMPQASTNPIRTHIFNMVPARGKLATFGFHISGVPVHLDAELRTDSDYGIDIVSRDISQTLTVYGSAATLWGVPADSRHDIERGRCLGSADPEDLCPSQAARRPLITLPTSCGPAGVGEETRLEIRGWGTDVVARDSFRSHHPAPNEHVEVGTTDCDRVPFDPSLEVKVDDPRAGAPSGAEFGLSLPSLGSAAGTEQSHLRRAEVSLPEGMSINPAAAGGLEACADHQLKIGSTDPVECPLASKIGTVKAKSPALREELGGAVYVRPQSSSDPESGEMFRVALVIENEERGLSVRLAGQVRADAETGKLSAVFDDNPQLPVSDVRLFLKPGPRAPLALPDACGAFAPSAVLTGWSGKIANVSSGFDVSCTPDAGRFTPSMEAGTVNPVAGEFSPFALDIAKPDGNSPVNGVSLDLPEGVLAKLRGNLGQRIGTARVAAGPGSEPYWLEGPVVLEGRYGDAPFSLRVTVPAKAGPFDLGNVVVRQKIYVDPVTAAVRVVSDPLPTIVKGVPARLQRIHVDVDRPGFTLNPTSCEQKRIGGTVTAPTGQSAAVGTRFQIGDCQALPFRPKLAMRFTGKRQVTTGKHPGVEATVRQTGVGEAGIERAVVTLPKSVALDPENAQALCEFEDGTKPDLENHCPKGSIVGKAKATTPLLDRPLAGNVYFVKNVERHPRTGNLIRKLPMIVVALRGEIAINLTGKSSTTKSGRLVNTFAGVPDAPITRFELDVDGGRNGILAVTRTRRSKIDLCARPKSHTANTRMRGQNGKRANYRLRVGTPCGRPKKAGRDRGR